MNPKTQLAGVTIGILRTEPKARPQQISAGSSDVIKFPYRFVLVS
jgi:hypothetical protein